jgi:hypothetical protein
VPHGPRPRTRYSYRFAWTPDFERVYVLHRRRGADHILTVLVPLEDPGWRVPASPELGAEDFDESAARST